MILKKKEVALSPKSSQGFEQVTAVEIENKSKLELFGLGLPVGVTYNFGKRFYTSVEAKFIVAYQKYNLHNLNKSMIISNELEFVTNNEANLKIKDLAIRN